MKSLTINKVIEDINIIIKHEKTLQKRKLINEEFFLHKNSKAICRISTKNTIKFCNLDFINNSSFSEKELLNNSLSLIKHPEMPKVISDYVNYHIDSSKTFEMIIKNLTKEGKYFWTKSTFKPNQTDNLNIAYTITSNTISTQAKNKISKLYECLYKLETKINEKTSLKYLIGFLEEKSMSLTQYTNYIASL